MWYILIIFINTSSYTYPHETSLGHWVLALHPFTVPCYTPFRSGRGPWQNSAMAPAASKSAAPKIRRFQLA